MQRAPEASPAGVLRPAPLGRKGADLGQTRSGHAGRSLPHSPRVWEGPYPTRAGRLAGLRDSRSPDKAGLLRTLL